MPKKQRGNAVVATNRRARHDYTIEDTYEAGIVLTGTEVKSLREGRASLVDGYAFVDGGEAWPHQPDAACDAMMMCANEASLSPGDYQRLVELAKRLPGCGEP